MDVTSVREGWPETTIISELAADEHDMEWYCQKLIPDPPHPPGSKYLKQDVLFKVRPGYRGNENYRAFAAMSDQYTDSIFLDLGTRNGTSALSLCREPSNLVLSWDISDTKRKETRYAYPELNPNVEFFLEDVDGAIPYFKDAALISLDIDHRGPHEMKLYEAARREGFKGLMLIDDMNYKRFPGMKLFWDSINLPKAHVPWAHYSGLGVVSFGQPFELIKI